MSTVTVGSSAQVQQALATAQSGDIILLAPGSYAEVGLSGFNFTGAGVTITSADLTHPAVVAGFDIQNSSGLTLSHMEVTVDPRIGIGVNVASDNNIHLDSLNVHAQPGDLELGVQFRSSTNVSLTNSNIHDTGVGVQHLNADGVTISNNNIHDLLGDGIHGAGTSNITISGNYLTNLFVQTGDHPDAIQFFTYGTTASAHDITITNNTYVRGAGGAVQGIFLGNEINMPYLNVTITGNAIVGGMWNGIAVGVGNNVNVSNNLVEGYVDQGSWITLQNTTNSFETNNTSTSYLPETSTTANTNLVSTGNVTINPGAVGDTSLLGSFANPQNLDSVSPPAADLVPPTPDPGPISMIYSMFGSDAIA